MRTAPPGGIRSVGITVGGVYAFYALAALPEAMSKPIEQNIVATLAWLPGVLMLIPFLLGRIRIGRVMALIASACQLAAICLWPLVDSGTGNRTDFWIHGFIGLAPIAMLLAAGVGAATLMLVVITVATEVVLRRIGAVTALQVTVVRTLFTLAYSGFVMLVVHVVISTLNRVHREVTATAGRRAARAGEIARAEEVARLDRLTHDYILALLAGAAEGTPTQKLMVQAEALSRQLASGADPMSQEDGIISMARRVIGRADAYQIPVLLTGQVSELDPAIDGPGPTVPSLVSQEFEAAVDEAMRNSVLHAGPLAEPRMALSLREDRITAELTDHGVGFDLTQHNPRLGVRMSILHRMRSLPGGWAEVNTAPGAGTRVVIGWRR
ncbi:hypothetical protein [Granulicoccus phenolivorans]|uniref:hypothetical protein n=1 Tax=Granulicoccus phenolivorans TaxID=266854 RepID=UPI0011AE75FC|nr:hypothetical protein [Granulicoccus phenolivorans]